LNRKKKVEQEEKQNADTTTWTKRAQQIDRINGNPSCASERGADYGDARQWRLACRYGLL